MLLFKRNNFKIIMTAESAAMLGDVRLKEKYHIAFATIVNLV